LKGVGFANTLGGGNKEVRRLSNKEGNASERKKEKWFRVKFVLISNLSTIMLNNFVDIKSFQDKSHDRYINHSNQNI